MKLCTALSVLFGWLATTASTAAEEQALPPPARINEAPSPAAAVVLVAPKLSKSTSTTRYVPIQGMVSIGGLQDRLSTAEFQMVQTSVVTAYRAVYQDATTDGGGTELLANVPPSTVPLNDANANIDFWRWPWQSRPRPTPMPSNKPIWRKPPRGMTNFDECWLCPDDDLLEESASATTTVALATAAADTAAKETVPVAVWYSTFYAAADDKVNSFDVDTLVNTMSSDQARYSKFQHEMCHYLRTSGMALFRTVHHCKFSILNRPATSTPNDQELVSSLCVDGKKRGQAVIILTRVDSTDLTEDDAIVLDMSVVQAYNKAYEAVGGGGSGDGAANAARILDSFAAKTAAMVETDDDSTIIMGEFHQVCTDDSGVDADMTPEQLKRMHDDFEANLCALLRADMSSSLRFVGQCMYRTFDNTTIGKHHHAIKGGNAQVA